MPDRDVFGPDTVMVAAYLATGPDDPGLAAWKREHPDCFEAGTWTRPADPATERRRRRSEATRTVGIGRERPPLDPATLSVADFQRVAAEAGAGWPSDPPSDLEPAASKAPTTLDTATLQTPPISPLPPTRFTTELPRDIDHRGDEPNDR